MSSTRLSVLAVEDDLGDGEILRLNLANVPDWELDFRRVTCLDDARAELERAPADVIFVDYCLGAENGIDVLRGLRRFGYEGPMIFLTGMGDEKVVVEAFHSGADDYLKKTSLHSVELKRSVSNALVKHDLQQELRKQRIEIERTNKELKKRNSEIQGFHHLLSHELKTPLTSALSFLEILSDEISGPLNDTQKEHLHIVQESCEQIVNCIDDLLDVARLESGKLALDRKPEWITDLIKGLVASMTPLAETRGITLSMSVAPNLPQVVIDKPRIKQVLTNLTNNALKFTPAGGRIDLMANIHSQDDGLVQVSVMDTGRGIELDQIDRVFNRLYQIEASDASELGGLGLGLTLSRDLVHLHGGEIWVTSKPGEGSTFSFTLPRHQGVPVGTEIRKKTVLVVEDDDKIATSLAIRLEAAGFAAMKASDGASGVEMAAKNRPDVMILDIAMPGGGGFAVAEHVRKLVGGNELPIIFLTATREPELRKRAEELGAHAFFEKPCPAERLLSAVRSAV